MSQVSEDMDIQLDVDDQEELELATMRHSAAHVMAEAVMEMFPEAKLAIGPPVEDGFYYDFDLPRALTPEDLEEIENRMAAHQAAAIPVRETRSRARRRSSYFRISPTKWS